MQRKSSGASGLAKTLLAIAIVGAINWGLVGIFNWNLVNAIFGGETATGSLASPLARAIYALVGLCGIAALFFLPKLGIWNRGSDKVGSGSTVNSTRIDDRSRVRP